VIPVTDYYNFNNAVSKAFDRIDELEKLEKPIGVKEVVDVIREMLSVPILDLNSRLKAIEREMEISS